MGWGVEEVRNRRRSPPRGIGGGKGTRGTHPGPLVQLRKPNGAVHLEQHEGNEGHGGPEHDGGHKGSEGVEATAALGEPTTHEHHAGHEDDGLPSIIVTQSDKRHGTRENARG